MSIISKRSYRGNRTPSSQLDKVLYGLLAAIILIFLAFLLIISIRGSPNDKAEGTENEQEHASASINTKDKERGDPTAGNESPNENKTEAATTAHDAPEKNTSSAKEEHHRAAEEEDIDSANEPQPGSATPWFLISILTLSTVANGCIAIFIFRYIRKRRELHLERIKLLNDKKFVEREDFQEALENFVTSVSKIGQELGKIKEFNQNAVNQIVTQTNRVLTEINIQSKGHGEVIEKLMDTFLSLNDKLNEKDAEITRYKEGYDTKKIKSSLTGYIKVRDRIQSYADNEKTSSNDLDKLLIIIESAIDNLGASEIEIKIGDNFYDEKYVGLTDDPEIIETDDPEKHHLIASIVKKGYEIIGQERNTTIRSAKLKIYKHEPKEN